MGYEMCTMMQDRNDSSGNSNNLIVKKKKKKILNTNSTISMPNLMYSSIRHHVNPNTSVSPTFATKKKTCYTNVFRGRVNMKFNTKPTQSPVL